MSKRAIGIIGGMGPMATLDLFGKVIAHTDARSDAEHIRVYMDCHTGIPDRTRAILHGGESPVPYIVESAKKLASIGAELLLIPCNTSHYYYAQICEESPVPVMNMIRETVQSLYSDGVQRVGLLATDGTLQAGVYQQELTARGIDTVCPTQAEQAEVMRLIYEGVKADA
ncbi:MAG: amino acid racemase, partial [Clostridia bacterium]|nr:amino acid racemase [Clostridia bacterium]